VWVLTAQTKPISVGLAKPDATGRIAVTLPTDPSMPPPTGVAVTIEPEGGVPVATGPAYLVGTTN
jgi:anti-sigma-K factor RskA